MEILIENIKTEFDNLSKNLEAYKVGNKAAGRRARRCTVELEKLMKQFRKESIEAYK